MRPAVSLRLGSTRFVFYADDALHFGFPSCFFIFLYHYMPLALQFYFSLLNWPPLHITFVTHKLRGDVQLPNGVTDWAALVLCLGRNWVHISVQRPAILTEKYYGSHLSWQILG
jgi:hypothetical protein